MGKEAVRFSRWLWTVMTRFWGWIGAFSTLLFVVDWIPSVHSLLNCYLGPNHRWGFLVAGLIGLLLSSFFAWRDEEIEHERYTNPRLGIEFDIADASGLFIRTIPADPPVKYVRVKPFTNSRVNNCRGKLLRILRWDGFKWVPTLFAEQLPLEWSYNDYADDMTIEVGSDLFLNVCAIPQGLNVLIPTTKKVQPNSPLRIAPLYWEQDFTNYQDAEFKFVVRVIGDTHAGDTIAIGIRRTVPWGDPIVRILPV
jgi:hypothetical protein